MKGWIHAVRDREPSAAAHPVWEGELAIQHGQASKEATRTQRAGVRKGSCCCSAGRGDSYRCTHNLTALALLLVKFTTNFPDPRFHPSFFFSFFAFEVIFCRRFKIFEVFIELRKKTAICHAMWRRTTTSWVLLILLLSVVVVIYYYLEVSC